MSNEEMEELIKRVVWTVVEKNYNVDKQSPRVLTYKYPHMEYNPIDEIAVGVKQVFDQLVTQGTTKVEEKQEQGIDDNEEWYHEGWDYEGWDHWFGGHGLD